MDRARSRLARQRSASRGVELHMRSLVASCWHARCSSRAASAIRWRTAPTTSRRLPVSSAAAPSPDGVSARQSGTHRPTSAEATGSARIPAALQGRWGLTPARLHLGARRRQGAAGRQRRRTALLRIARGSAAATSRPTPTRSAAISTSPAKARAGRSSKRSNFADASWCVPKPTQRELHLCQMQLRSSLLASALAALAACQQAAASPSQNIAIDDQRRPVRPTPRSKRCRPTRAATTPSNELANGDDNPDVNDLDAINSELSEEAAMKLYYSPAPARQAPHILLHEIGLEP